ncbi:MAG: ABC transporter permease, partial [Mycetocola sp.]
MTLLRRLASILRWLLQRSQAERELNDEMETFVDMAAADKIRDGAAPEEARRLAVLQLGGIEQAKERVRTGRHGAWLDDVGRDIRYAVRTLRRAPLFAATVVATMGLALGLVGSAFTFLNAYLIRPVNLPNPRALYALSWDTKTTYYERFGLADYEALEPEARRLASVAATLDASVMQDAVSTRGLLVTGNYFEMLGARPAVGRLLRRDDAAARGAGPVVVLSHELWRSRYGSDPAIVGQRIALGRQRFEVVGVTEPHAQLARQELVSFWVPLTMADAFRGADVWSQPDARTLAVIGRVREDVTAASMQAWLEVWLRRRFPPPSDATPVAVRVDSLATRFPVDNEAVMMSVLIMSMFGLVLLVAAANITNLMLARALARQPEIVVRLALGASSWRVARQLIVESLVLAVPAAAAGLVLVTVTARVVTAMIAATWPAGAPPLENILLPLEPDVRVMAFLAAMAVVSAVLITLAPAGRLAGMRLTQASRGEASPDRHGSRLRSGLVAMQVGACALFLIGAVGLFDQSSRLANPPLNLSYERVSIVRIDTAVRPKVATQLASEAAVQYVAGVWRPPMASSLPTTAVKASTTNIATTVGYTGVSPEYFALFDIQIVRGRPFTPAEAAAGSAVALVSKATAAALWPGLDPIGQTLELAAVPEGRPDPRLPRGRLQVIGVAEDVANGAITDGIDATCVYFLTDVQGPANMALLVRGRTDDDILPTAVTAAVNKVAPDTPFQLFSLRANVADIAWGFRGFSLVISVLGVVGLLFAYSGTHAVVSFLMAQRKREFGVRMALGASAWQIVWGMLIQTSRPGLIGLVVGLAVAAGLVRLLTASAAILDFGARPFVVGATTVLIATTVAALVPLLG